MAYSLYTVKLTAMPDAWRLFSLRKTDPGFKEFSQRVFERDQHTCKFCGFQAVQYQEIINLDMNYRNNKLANLATACCFCSQCFFLESVGRDDYGGGLLVYLPEISQGNLNGLCHVLFCAISNSTNYRADAQNIYRGLKLRAQIVDKRLGEGMSDPSLFGRMLLEAGEKEREKVEENLLGNIRLLPSYTKFGKQVEDWAKAALEELSTSQE
jgi:intracellular multiplication protein IcmJ